MQTPAAQFGPKGVARRVRNRVIPIPDVLVMTTVVCSDCGAQFEIGHRANCPDRALANRQAVWLADQFVWDHIQENKHHSSITLPPDDELNKR